MSHIQIRTDQIVLPRDVHTVSIKARDDGRYDLIGHFVEAKIPATRVLGTFGDERLSAKEPGLQTTARAETVVEPVSEGLTVGPLGGLKIDNAVRMSNEPLMDDWWRRSRVHLSGIMFYTPRDEQGRLRNLIEWTAGHVVMRGADTQVKLFAVKADTVALSSTAVNSYVLWKRGSDHFVVTERIEEYLGKTDHLIVAYVNDLTGINIALGETTVGGRGIVAGMLTMQERARASIMADKIKVDGP